MPWLFALVLQTRSSRIPWTAGTRGTRATKCKASWPPCSNASSEREAENERTATFDQQNNTASKEQGGSACGASRSYGVARDDNSRDRVAFKTGEDP